MREIQLREKLLDTFRYVNRRYWRKGEDGQWGEITLKLATLGVIHDAFQLTKRSALSKVQATEILNWIRIESAKINDPAWAKAVERRKNRMKVTKPTPEELVGKVSWPFDQWKDMGHKKNAIEFARQLQELGMKDVDIRCWLGDLYWDAFGEAGHPGKYNQRELTAN
jgi:hypothetical protein